MSSVPSYTRTAAPASPRPRESFSVSQSADSARVAWCFTDDAVTSRLQQLGFSIRTVHERAYEGWSSDRDMSTLAFTVLRKEIINGEEGTELIEELADVCPGVMRDETKELIQEHLASRNDMPLEALTGRYKRAKDFCTFSVTVYGWTIVFTVECEWLE